MKNSSSIALLVLAVGIFYTFTSPQYSDAQALVAQAADYRNIVDNVSRIKEARDSLLTSFESIPAGEKDRLMKILPDNVDSVELARDLDTIASKYGIAVQALQVDPPSESNRPMLAPDAKQAYESSIVAFSFVSNYSNFVKFLTDIEKNLRLMDVRAVTFRTADPGLYEHRITIETYWLKH